MVAAAVVGATGASASMVASASADGLPILRPVYQGLQVNLPGALKKEIAMVGGTRIAVRVVPKGKQPRVRATARVTVTRTDPGKKGKVVFRKSLRKGEARFLIVATVGVKYQVRAQVGKRSWVTRFRTVETEAEATPYSPPQPPCAPAGKLVPSLATVAAGGTLPYAITNAGNAPLTYGSGNGWSQQVGGIWSNVPSPGGLGGTTTHTIYPGETQTGNGAVWPTLTPGTYSMTIVATCSDTKADGTVTFKAIPLQTPPITVTAAAGR